MEDKAQKFWDRQAGRYDAGTRRFGKTYYEILEKTKKHLRPGDKVLDFGCATGGKTLELAGSVSHIHGLDISGEMIREARNKKNERQAENVSFSQGTIFSGEFETASFDKIVSFSVIHLLDDSEEAVCRIFELLRPGGKFISLTACFGEAMPWKGRLGYFVFRVTKQLGLNPLHLNTFTVKDVEDLMKRQGFEIVSTEKVMDEITACIVVARKG
jgi:ubiquinone/menaquinone biosynthesis C-methylase UbiE